MRRVVCFLLGLDKKKRVSRFARNDSKHCRLAVAEAERLPASVGGPATIDRQGMAVDEAAGFVVREKCDGTGDVIGRSKSSHRHAAGDIGIGVAAAGLIRN